MPLLWKLPQTNRNYDASGIFLAKFSRGVKIIRFVTEDPFMSCIYFCSATVFMSRTLTLQVLEAKLPMYT